MKASACLAIVLFAARALACETDAQCEGKLVCRSGACVDGGEPGAGLSKPGTYIMSAERLFGLVSSTVDAENSGSTPRVTSKDSATQFGLLLSNAGNILVVPRVALDASVGYGITLGGAVGYASVSREGEATATTAAASVKTVTNGPKTSGFVITPRVGWLSMFGSIGIWLRGGISYWSTSSTSEVATATGKETQKIDASGVAATIEPTLLYVPIEHTALSFSALADIPLSGTSTATFSGTKQEASAKLRNLGATVGLHLWF